LQCIERAEALRRPVSHEQLPGGLEVALIHGRGDQDTLLRKIGPEAPAGDFQGLQI